jgi:hypothetical protein
MASMFPEEAIRVPADYILHGDVRHVSKECAQFILVLREIFVV